MCEYCQGVNINRKDISTGNRLHTCIRKSRLYITYGIESNLKFGRKLKINYCPMCARKLGDKQ